MASEEYPFNLQNIFAITSDISRDPELSQPGETGINVEVKVIFNTNFPKRMQVNFRMRSATDNPIKLLVEVIGLFECLTDAALTDRELQIRFLENRGLYILWTYTSQLIRIITGQMGMAPLDIHYPATLELGGLAIIEK